MYYDQIGNIQNNYGNPKITMIKTTQNFNTITTNTNVVVDNPFPGLGSQKASNRLLKRKINHSQNEPNPHEIRSQKEEMQQKSAGVGGALTQFKKRKQRRIIRELMEETANGYGNR